MLASHGRLHEVTQVIVNPSEEPFFNVISTMSNKEDVKVRTLAAVLCCQGRFLPRCLSLLSSLAQDGSTLLVLQVQRSGTWGPATIGCHYEPAPDCVCVCVCGADVLQPATTGAGCSVNK